MGLNEVLTNPLFVPLLVAVLTIISNAVFLYWLRRWQYRAEYIISNVDKTYIPLTAEINHNTDLFRKFYENPSDTEYLKYTILDKIRRSGLFEFVKSHDRKLCEKLLLFNDEIYPRLKELDRLREEMRLQLMREWTNHVENVISDKNAKKHAKTFVDSLFSYSLYFFLLNNNTKEITRLWDEKLYNLASQYNLYIPNVKFGQERLLTSQQQKFPKFDVSENELEKLIQLSQPRLQKVHDFYNQTTTILDKEVVNGLIPMMQKYITNPLS